MRKIRLLKLINEYDKSRGSWLRIFATKEDRGISFLKKFLNSPKISSRLNSEEVTYQEFIDYLLKNEWNDEFDYIHDKNYQTIDKNAATFFKKFIDDTSSIQSAQDKKSPIIPAELWFNIIHFLDIETLVKLSLVSSFYYEANKTLPYWRKQLCELGLSQAFIIDLAKNRNINFKILSSIIAKFDLTTRKNLVRNLKAEQISYVDTCKNALDLAALSGDVNAMQSVVRGLPKGIKLTFHLHTLYCAIFSDNKAAIEYAIQQLKINPKQNETLNVLYLAASEKKEKSLKYLLELSQSEGLGLIEDLEKNLGKEGFAKFFKQSSKPIQDLIRKGSETENEQAIIKITDEL